MQCEREEDIDSVIAQAREINDQIMAAKDIRPLFDDENDAEHEWPQAWRRAQQTRWSTSLELATRPPAVHPSRRTTPQQRSLDRDFGSERYLMVVMPSRMRSMPARNCSRSSWSRICVAA